MAQVFSNILKEDTKKTQLALYLETVNFTGILVCNINKDLWVQNKPQIFLFHRKLSNFVQNFIYAIAMKVKSTN
jgi:hypothetical protein